MSGFFSKIFGGKKKQATAAPDSPQALVETTMQGLIDRAGLELTFEVRETGADEITVELSGADEELLTEKEGALLDAFQLFFKRMIQHQLPDSRLNVAFDCNGYRDESSKALVELAERLKEKALEQGRSVYLRALPPKDRKIVHQHLANDDRVRSRSVGDGLFKKIKIYPVKSNGRDREATEETDSEATETV
ncbi:MAG TPA: R3H domain-containing nucleic acid-binding protein [Bdellovibrionales bacterium]|nr:R3H domain-containing nucleic acid-binding protein [Bdellovibrionales bacterium]